ncbi:HNH endonuclease signature motif containing protein [Pseudofrankia sp. EUN1h]|uniref:HNH endonuclease signature motif containing protein n=1 Tax=Pseudofrankia sp. EUN1h TaxID=1834515 RepID=UPI002FF5570B
MAADAHWRRVLTDPRTGTVLDLRHRRVPTPALARLVRHRDTRCVYPGCAMPAVACDLDHTIARADGGRTALDNLGPLCRRHHVMKHGQECHFPHSCRGGPWSWVRHRG